MEVIDDEGDLFGVVNVIDALVVLLVLAVGVAGVALVVGNDDPPAPETDRTYATLDLGTQPSYVAEAISEGDIYNRTEEESVTVTDVFFTPREDGVGVTARVQLNGSFEDERLSYAGEPFLLDRNIYIITSRYDVTGTVIAVGRSQALTKAETTVVLQDTMQANSAVDVTPGDEVRVAGRTVATVQNVTQFATSKPDQRRVFLTATLQTRQEGGQPRFGGVSVRRGQSVSLSTTEYTVDGTITQVGGTARLKQASVRTVTLRIEDVEESFADALRPGMREQVDGMTVARITNVKVKPSTMIVTSDDGSVNVVNHPTNRDVTLTAEVRVRGADSGPQFKSNPLRQGSMITLDLGTTTVRATVVSLNG